VLPLWKYPTAKIAAHVTKTPMMHAVSVFKDLGLGPIKPLEVTWRDQQM